MKLLVSAFACRPFQGSEDEVGLKAALAGALENEVWILTRAQNREPLEEFFRESLPASEVHVISVEPAVWWRWLERPLGIFGHQMYYEAWQRAAARRGKAFAASVAFDVVHHVTYAAFWARTGVSELGLPFVWGPVGGGVESPRGMWPILGLNGLVREFGRYVYRRLAWARRSVRATIRSTTLAFSQNSQTSTLLLGASQIELLPNALAALPLPELQSRPSDVPYCMFVGRLLPYKAAILAVEALSRSTKSEMRLLIAGTGPEANRVKRRARRLGLESRVELLGRLPREEVLTLLAGAVALVHPALHEDSSLAVGEALALGTPVVLLDWGGPPAVAAEWPAAMHKAISVGGPWREVADHLGDAVDHFAARTERFPVVPPTRSFSKALAEGYRKAARHPNV